MENSLKTVDLVKEYRGRKVVNQVSLLVEPGKIVGLLGPNGAGKSTTFRMVSGLIKPDKGSVFFDGKDVTNYPMYQRALMGIGYLPQEPTIFARLTVRENILLILENLKMHRRDRRRRVEEMLEEMKLKHLEKSLAGDLSGGEKRRLEVTRVLSTSPKFMMWDEPFAAVDPKIVQDLQKIIIELRNRGIGILITDHKPKELLAIASYAYLIVRGEILVQGSASEVANNEKATEEYLADTFEDSPDSIVDKNTKSKKIFKQASKALKLKDYPLAISLFTDIIALTNDERARIERGKCFFEVQDYASAIFDFKSITPESQQKYKISEWITKTQERMLQTVNL